MTYSSNVETFNPSTILSLSLYISLSLLCECDTQNNTPATFDSTTFTSLPVTSTPSSIPIAIGTSGVPLDFTILIAADNHQLWITSLKGT